MDERRTRDDAWEIEATFMGKSHVVETASDETAAKELLGLYRQGFPHVTFEARPTTASQASEGRTAVATRHGEPSKREKVLLTALRNAWAELNAIKARDGVAYHRNDGMAYCDEGWWATVTEMAAAAIEATTGEPPKPWPFAWERTGEEPQKG